MKRLARLFAWRRSLSGKTALRIALPLLVVFAGFLAYGLVVRKARIERYVIDSQSRHGAMFIEVLRETTKTTGRHDLDGLVTAMRKAEGYSDVLVTDWRGVVGHAKNKASLGRRLRRDAWECRGCHQGATATLELAPRTAVVDGDRGRALRTVVPLQNHPECQRCHGTVRAVAGIAVLEAPLTELSRPIQRMVLETVVMALVMMLTSLVAVYTMQHRLVVRPIEELTARARELEDGGLVDASPGGPEAADEVAELRTAFARMVERLAAARARLEEKVRVRTAELGEMGQELERLNAKLMHVERLTTMGELSATIAHQVRTPLNALAINLQLLKRELGRRKEPPSEPDEAGDKRDTLAIIEVEVARLNAVIEEFMTYARLPRPRLLPIDLNDVARSAVFLLELEARRDEVALSFTPHGEPVPLLGDVDKLRHVLINLVVNALQAVERGGHVDIAIEADDEVAIATVDDDGPGIAPDVAANMFNAFFTTKAEGTGLGLAIAARVVRDHRGDISVGRSPSGGARFRVTLPVAGAGPGVDQ